MSVIYPKTYRLIAEELASGYAKVRDAIWQDGVNYEDSALGDVLNISDYQTQNADDTLDGNKAPTVLADMDPSSDGYDAWIASTNFVAPEGSIGQDLGSALFTFANTTIKLSNARNTAARLFSPYLRALNQHVLRRTHGITSMNGYYQTYAYILDSDNAVNSEDNLNLFDDPAMAGRQTTETRDMATVSTYFSADFVELSAQIGVTIDDEFQAP